MAKVYKFKLLRGTYVDPDGVKHEPNSKTATLEASTDLAKRFGAEKFQLLGAEMRDDAPAAPEFVPEGGTEREGPSDEELHGMTIAELKEYASDNDIDLGTASKHDKIVEVIIAALDAR